MDILRMIYFSYVCSVMSYGIIFRGNSHHSNSIFKSRKRIIRIITNTGSRDSCLQLFKQLQILSLPSQYISSLLVFVNKNRDLFQSNSEIHDLNTRFKYNLHLPSTITDTNRRDFNVNANQTFQDINTWFKANLLTLNLNKTQYLEFRTKNYYNVNTQMKYDQECLTSASEIKFLGLTIDDTLSWKQHIEPVLNKMCTACYALRNVKHSSNRHAKSNLFHSYTLYYKLWYNFLG